MKKLIGLLFCLLLCGTTIAQTLYIYGGKDHDVYLGKFNGSKYDTESIWNSNGKYGSKYNANSIWNTNGTYGGKFSQYSPWNSNASYPPVLKDERGKEYGYLTADKYKVEHRYREQVECMVDNHERIAKDPGKWYEVIMN